MDLDINLYVLKSRFYNCYIHAYDMGKVGPPIGYSRPPIFLMVFIGIMAIEADYTFLTRIEFFTESDFVPVYHHGGGSH